MADGRANNGGKRPGAGNPGYGTIEFVKTQLNQYLPLWWTEVIAMVGSDDKELKKFALAEINKLQAKVIPSTVQGEGGGAIVIKVANDIVSKHDFDSSAGNNCEG